MTTTPQNTPAETTRWNIPLIRKILATLDKTSWVVSFPRPTARHSTCPAERPAEGGKPFDLVGFLLTTGPS